jgi:hypothetical protein
LHREISLHDRDKASRKIEKNARMDSSDRADFLML